MADAAAARREARRRKILENSQNRLQRIAGKSEGELITESQPIRTFIPEESFAIPVLSDSSSSFRIGSSLNNGVVSNETPSLVATSSSHFNEPEAAGDGLGELNNDFAALLSSTTPDPTSTQEATFWTKVVLYKYDVVLVSLLVQLLCSLSVLTFDETHFFLPLVVHVVTKMIWFPAAKSSNFANALLLMNGISVDRVEKIMSVTRWVSMFFQDVCVYLFTTICVQALYITVTNCLIT